MSIRNRFVINKLQNSDSDDDGQIYSNDKQNFITISGSISWKMADGFFNALSEFEIRHQKKQLRIYINSRGGDIYAMTKIYDHIRHSPCPIITLSCGSIFSGAIFIFLAGDLRLTLPNAMFAFHWPIRQTERGENPDETKEAADWQNNFFERLMNIAKDRTKISDKGTLRKLFRTSKTFDAEMAVKYGVAHKILEPARKQLPKNWKKFIKP